MNIKVVTLLAGGGWAQRVSADGARRIAVREALRLDDFAAALGARLGLPCVAREAPLGASEHEFLICEHEALEALLNQAGDVTALARRSLLLNADINTAMTLTEAWGLAGAIDARTYAQWCIDYPHPRLTLCGLSRLSGRFDGSPTPAAPGKDYRWFSAGSGRDLPDFLASYLQALPDT